MTQAQREKETAPAALPDRFRELAEQMAALGRAFHLRGWVLGTSGNFSAVLSEQPLRLAITASGVDKGTLTPEQILEIDADGRVFRGAGVPSAERLLHLAVVGERRAGAVLHTHSVWSTVLSDACFRQGGVRLEGYEMLKGLEGVASHEHSEWLPILENSQDLVALSASVQQALAVSPASHGFLLRRHGLYTWGRDIAEAARHVEVLEFLLEVVGRTGKD